MPDGAIPSFKHLFTDARSDRLPELINQIGPILERLGTFGVSLRMRLVIDTSTVIADLFWIVSKRKNPEARTSLEEAIRASVVIAVAPPQIDSEIRGNLEELSEQTGVSQEVIWGAWLDYRRLLTIVEPQAVPTSGTEYLERRDPSDIPFLYLSENIAAAAVVSADPDLLSADKRLVVRPTAITIDLRNYARAKTIQLSIVGMGTLTINVGLNMVIDALQSLPTVGRALAALPRWLHALMIAMLIWALASSKRRDAIADYWERLKSFAGSAFEAMKPTMKELLDTALDAQAKAETARLAVMSKVRERPLRLHQAVHLALVRSSSALTPAQLEATVRELGYRSKARSLQAAIVRTLRADVRFKPTQTGWIVNRAHGQ